MAGGDQWRYLQTYYRDPSSPFFLPRESLDRGEARKEWSTSIGAAAALVACPLLLAALGDWVGGAAFACAIAISVCGLMAAWRLRRHGSEGSRSGR